MPNTEVKLTNAESTWPEAAREDRKLLIKEKTLTNVGVFFHMHKFEGSRIKVPGRIRERCHPSNRFFTPCHISVFLLSYKAFLSPFRMTIGGESVIMMGTIRRHNEENDNSGSAADNIQYPVPVFLFP